MVKQALDQFMKKCEKELKGSLEKDKNSELNRVFQVYSRLDELDRGVLVYLDYLVEV